MTLNFNDIQVGGGNIPPGYSRVPITNSDCAVLTQPQVNIIKAHIKNYIEKFGQRPMLFKLIRY